MCIRDRKIHYVERTQYAFLDHSKTFVFIDVIKIEIPFKYSHQKNLYIEPP